MSIIKGYKECPKCRSNTPIYKDDKIIVCIWCQHNFEIPNINSNEYSIYCITTVYQKGQEVRCDDKIYISKEDNNVGNLPTNKYWKVKED